VRQPCPDNGAPLFSQPRKPSSRRTPATAIAAAGVGVEVNLLFSITLRPSSARRERHPLSLSRSITRMPRYHPAPVDCETLHEQMEIKAGIPRYEFAGEHFRPINVRNYIHRAGDGAVYHTAVISLSLSLPCQIPIEKIARRRVRGPGDTENKWACSSSSATTSRRRAKTKVLRDEGVEQQSLANTRPVRVMKDSRKKRISQEPYYVAASSCHRERSPKGRKRERERTEREREREKARSFSDLAPPLSFLPRERSVTAYPARVHWSR